jgi:MFS family permease
MIDEGRGSVRRLALARVLSATGSWAGGLALPFVLFQITGSGVWVAASWFITFGITGLLSPLSGTIADRFDRRRVMVVSDLLSAASWGLLTVVRDPAWMLVIAFVATVASQPFWAASGAAIPNLVPTEDLTWANSTLSLAGSVASLAGPAIGGVLIAVVGAGATFGVNAVSYVLEAVLVGTTPGRFSAARDETKERERGGMLRGFGRLFVDPALRALAVVWTMQYFAIDAALVADPPLVRLFAAGALGYGLLNAGWGGGALVGSFLARRTGDRSRAAAVAGGSIVTAISYGLISVSPWFAPIVVLMFTVSFADAFNNVAGQSIVQIRTPDEIRGRTWAALGGLGLVANTVAFTASGLLVDALGPQAVYGLGALAAIASFPFLPGLAAALRRDEPATGAR